MAIIKHANPCGIAVGDDIAVAHARPMPATRCPRFGGMIATNRPVTAEMAEQVKDVFTEVVVAPASTPTRWRSSTARRTSGCSPAGGLVRRADVETRPISGGLLMQSRDAVDAGSRAAATTRRVVAVSGEAADEATSPTWSSPGGRSAR